MQTLSPPPIVGKLDPWSDSMNEEFELNREGQVLCKGVQPQNEDKNQLLLLDKALKLDDDVQSAY